MSDEERQRQMDFIVDNLTRVTARLEIIGERVDRIAAVQERSELQRQADAVRIGRVEESIVTLTRIAQGLDERLDKHEVDITDMKQVLEILTKLVSKGRNGSN